MNLRNISKSIFVKNSSEYISIIFFLLVFSVFIIFAIKPSLTTVFSLRKEESDLKKIDKIYEEKIINIISIQTQTEQNRDNLPLLIQSIPEHPEVNKIIEDVKKSADKNSMTINKASIVDINLSSTNQELQDVKLIMEVGVSFDNFKKFITDIFSQRRLKIVDNVIINRDKESSSSSDLKIILTIDGFYL